MPIIECLSCSMEIVLPTSYDNYRGEIKCESCESLLKVKIVKGKPQKTEIKRKITLK